MRSTSRRAKTVLALVVAAAATAAFAAGCGSSSSSTTTSSPATLSLKISEKGQTASYQAPKSAPGGLVTVNLPTRARPRTVSSSSNTRAATARLTCSSSSAATATRSPPGSSFREESAASPAARPAPPTSTSPRQLRARRRGRVLGSQRWWATCDRAAQGDGRNGREPACHARDGHGRQSREGQVQVADLRAEDR